ncbi:hypothetical protein SDC9_173807 [bioreactor metagenome]|uniref:DUF4276 family protein n=1 Tax=bioreactor metagenome TaxID=1076179 RepID=A0A645GRY0_9ZZZZ
MLFIQTVANPLLLNYYNDVEIIQYAQMKRQKANKYLESIITLGFDYLILADIDEEASVKQKKNKIKARFDEAAFNNMVIVIAEIESWFVAGIPTELLNKWGIKNFERTELLVKEEFNQLYGSKFRSRIDFMQEILKYYSIDTAIEKNVSFNFFYKSFLNPEKQ